MTATTSITDTKPVSDRARIVAALEQRAKLCRTEAASHRWTGERFKGIRQTLRDEAVACIELAGRMEEVLPS